MFGSGKTFGSKFNFKVEPLEHARLLTSPPLEGQSTTMSVQKIAASVSRQTNAVVVSAGLMEKTVKVRVGVQKWNKHIGKVYSSPLSSSLFTFTIQISFEQRQC